MIISVASGKGGTGKTIISTALALAVKNSTYVDLDVEEPNGALFIKPEIKEEISYHCLVPQIDEEKCIFCGACANACEFHALAVIPKIRSTIFFPDLCHSCGACSYVCPEIGVISEIPREIGKIFLGNGRDIQYIGGRLKIGLPSGVPLIRGIVHEHLSEKSEGLVIIDAPPGTACSMVESIKKSDWVLLVTEPTPFGLHDLELAVEVVKKMKKKAGIILNKGDGKTTLIDEYSQRIGIPILLRIPYSLDIQRAYSAGIPLNEAMPGINQALQELLDHSLNIKITMKDDGTEK